MPIFNNPSDFLLVSLFQKEFDMSIMIKKVFIIKYGVYYGKIVN